MAFARSTPRKSTRTPERSENDVVELFVWGGDWGLPTLDTESLQAVAITRFSGAPAKVTYCNNPWKSPSHRIPFFRHGDKYFYSARELGTHLQMRNFSCDSSLTALQCSEVITYGFHLIEDMQPALQFFCWAHVENFNTVIRPFYGYRLPWLYKMWYPEQIKNKAIAAIKTISPDIERDLKAAEIAVLERARICVHSLSEKLGSKEFFLPGTTPTTLDAIVFSYLAPFLKIPLVHNPVKEIIMKTPNLEAFVTRIVQRYLSSGAHGDTEVRGGFFSKIFGYTHQDPQTSVASFENPTFRKIFWVALVASAMCFYARRLGIFPGLVRDASYDDEDEEEDDYEF